MHLTHGVVVGERRQEHERHLAVLAQVGSHVEAAHAFHADVEQREVGTVFARQQDGVITVVGVDHFVARFGQAVRQRGQHQTIVVHDKDLAALTSLFLHVCHLRTPAE